MSSPVTGFSGFNSGLPIDDIIAKLIAAERQPLNLIESQKKTLQTRQGVFNNVKARVTDLLTAIQKLTKRDVNGGSIFDTLKGSSSNDQIATATVESTASAQTLSLEVKALPTSTKAASTSLVGKFDNTTTVEQLGITTGTFTLFSNGTAHEFTINAGDTMGTLLSNIDTAIPEITSAAIVDGKITFGYSGAPATAIYFGAGGDTSNFLAKTHLSTAVNDGAGTITASQVNTTIDLGADVSTAAANLNTPVTDGTFTINGISFDTTAKSLSEIISEINNSDAKVTAAFNLGSNRLELKAKDTGSTLISLGDSSTGGGTGNFLEAMGLIAGGNITTSQTAGGNAEFVLNGVTMYSTATTVDETVHGLTGVTLSLKKAEVGTTVNINIQRDQDSLKAAIKDVVDKFNKAITYIDQQTDAQANGALKGESQLIRLRTQIRQMFTSQVAALAGTSYDSLQQAGISTGAVTGSATASSQLQFDESKFDAAYAANPNVIEQLFIGRDLYDALDGTSGDDGFKGVLTQIQDILSDTTYPTSGGGTSFGALYDGPGENGDGLFASWQNSANRRIKSLDETIARGEERLERKEKILRQQFTAMDRMIGQFQSQGAALTNLMSQLSAGN